MLRIFFALFLLSSCTLGVSKKGGEERYIYRPQENYSLDELKEISPQIISMETKEPPAGKLKELLSPELGDLEKTAILVFETHIQGTRSGLAGEGKIYPTPRGKQIITEKFLTIWDEALPLVATEMHYLSSRYVKESQTLSKYGQEVDDHIQSHTRTLEENDLSYLNKGRKTPLQTIINPQGMRDLSLLLVPARELMGGPKWSEHHKHLVNELARELKLDAVLVIYSEADWVGAHSEKLSGDHRPEELRVKIEATTLIPLNSYHERLQKRGLNERPAVNLAAHKLVGELKIPLHISVEPEQENFQTIQERLINPLFKTYRDLSIMVMARLTQEWKITHAGK